MKRFIVTLLSITMLLLAGCGKDPVQISEDEQLAIRRDFTVGDYCRILQNDIPLSDELDQTDVCVEIYHKINIYRISNGVGQLQWNNDLADAAAIRAQEASVCWSHTRPDGTDYYTVNPLIVWAENLAKGYTTADEVVDAWIASPTHRDNLLCADLRYVAIAKYGEYYACEFCY